MLIAAIEKSSVKNKFSYLTTEYFWVYVGPNKIFLGMALQYNIRRNLVKFWLRSPQVPHLCLRLSGRNILCCACSYPLVPFKLRSLRRGYCWQLIASKIPATSSSIAGKIKGLKISFCLKLMPNFECEEVTGNYLLIFFIPF